MLNYIVCSYSSVALLGKGKYSHILGIPFNNPLTGLTDMRYQYNI